MTSKFETYTLVHKSEVPFFNVLHTRSQMNAIGFILAGYRVKSVKQSDGLFLHQQEYLFDIKKDPRLFFMEMTRILQKEKELVSWNVGVGDTKNLENVFTTDIDQKEVKSFCLLMEGVATPQKLLAIHEVTIKGGWNLLALLAQQQQQDTTYLAMVFQDFNNPATFVDMFVESLDETNISHSQVRMDDLPLDIVIGRFEIMRPKK